MQTLKLNQTYYKSLQGIFFTNSCDIDLLKKSIKQYTITNYNTKQTKSKYDANAIKLFDALIANCDALYFSSGNLIFYIKGGAIYITKQGIKYTNDIAHTICNDDASAIKYDAQFDKIYQITRASSANTNDAGANIDALRKLANANK